MSNEIPVTLNAFFSDVGHKIRKIKHELEACDAARLKLITRRMAEVELDMQALRSLFESHLMAADIDNMEEVLMKTTSAITP